MSLLTELVWFGDGETTNISALTGFYLRLGLFAPLREPETLAFQMVGRWASCRHEYGSRN